MPHQALNILDLDAEIRKNGKNCRFSVKNRSFLGMGVLS